MEKSFARKLTWKPLVNSLIFGAAIGTSTFIILNQNWGIGISVGILAFFFESLILYPRYLPRLYGLWRINDGNIYYYDYSTWQKRIQAIFLPFKERQVAIPFNEIDFYSLIVSSKNNKVTPRYIVLRLDDGHDVALDISWNVSRSGKPEKDVEWVVDFITSKLNQKTVKVLRV